MTTGLVISCSVPGGVLAASSDMSVLLFSQIFVANFSFGFPWFLGELVMLRVFLLRLEGRGSACREGKSLSCLLIPDPEVPPPWPSSPSPLSVVFTKTHLLQLLKCSRGKSSKTWRTLRQPTLFGH